MQVFKDGDADIATVAGLTIGVIGYGNQGRSQALNFRDSGLAVIVADSNADVAKSAQDEGFSVLTIAELAEKADVLLVLVPDDQMAELYDREILPSLRGRDGKTLVFASGYAVAFNLIALPPALDVLLLAPRMIGRGLRSGYLEGTGFSALIAVEQDASGHAFERLLGLSKAVGATRGGAFMSSFREEAIVDLFFEQTGELYAFRTMFEVLVEAGFSPETVVLDMYGSGEIAESYSAVRDIGLWRQLKLHSTTSQYGQEVVALREFDVEAARSGYRRILKHLTDGSFTSAWQSESAEGYPELTRSRGDNSVHPMQVAEDKLYAALGRR